MSDTKAHCNECGGDHDHRALHIEKTSWQEDEQGISGGDKYETLKCGGCGEVKLRHTSWFSEDDRSTVNYFPAALFRKPPAWLKGLWLDLRAEDEFVESLLKEIYVALQNNSSRLAAMGVRALLERIMVTKVGDQGSFERNLSEFESKGFVSRIQRERVGAILEVGHAAIHRGYDPKTADVVTLLDIAEHIVESVYLHEAAINSLRKAVPPRAPRK